MRLLLALLASLWGAAPEPALPDESAARHEKIESLKKAAQAGKGDADSLRRLGDLYLEEHYAVDDSKGAPNAVLAAQQYRALVDTHPAFGQLDAVLLSQGEALQEAGDAKGALAAWQRVVKDFPRSKSAGDAWLAIGKQLFEGSRDPERLADVQDALQKALKGKTSDAAGAHLLLARAANESGEYPSALDHLRQAVDAAGEDDADTAQEARREFVAIYTRAGDPANAIAEVKKVGGPQHSWEMLKELATAYHDLGRTAEAARLFRQLIQERPTSPDVPLFRCRLTGYVMRGTDKKAMLAEVRELSASIKKIQSLGDFASEADRASFTDARAKAMSIISTLATNWHEEAQSSGDPSAVKIAEDMCNAYLALFPESPPAEIKRCSEGF